tara:strand:- start:4527 stop:4889 length:363 start_codon:yes stop_codon:yes gene_type:complete
MVEQKKKVFDYREYQLKDTVEKVKLDVDGAELEIGVKKLGHVRKQKLISDCYVYGTGTVGFDHEKYGREAMKMIIVDAPWGPTNDMFLMSLDDSPLTEALATIVPDPFSVGNKLEDLKKD